MQNEWINSMLSMYGGENEQHIRSYANSKAFSDFSNMDMATINYMAARNAFLEYSSKIALTIFYRLDDVQSPKKLRIDTNSDESLLFILDKCRQYFELSPNVDLYLEDGKSLTKVVDLSIIPEQYKCYLKIVEKIDSTVAVQIDPDIVSIYHIYVHEASNSTDTIEISFEYGSITLPILLQQCLDALNLYLVTLARFETECSALQQWVQIQSISDIQDGQRCRIVIEQSIVLEDVVVPVVDSEQSLADFLHKNPVARSSNLSNIRNICSAFPRMRKVRGDGSCFYRSVAFAVLEGLLANELDDQLTQFLGKMICSDFLCEEKKVVIRNLLENTLSPEFGCGRARQAAFEDLMRRNHSIDEALVMGSRCIVADYFMAQFGGISMTQYDGGSTSVAGTVKEQLEAATTVADAQMDAMCPENHVRLPKLGDVDAAVAPSDDNASDNVDKESTVVETTVSTATSSARPESTMPSVKNEASFNAIDAISANYGMDLDCFVKEIILSPSQYAEDLILTSASQAYEARVMAWLLDARVPHGLKLMCGDEDDNFSWTSSSSISSSSASFSSSSTATKITEADSEPSKTVSPFRFGVVHVMLFSGHYDIIYSHHTNKKAIDDCLSQVIVESVAEVIEEDCIVMSLPVQIDNNRSTISRNRTDNHHDSLLNLPFNANFAQGIVHEKRKLPPQPEDLSGQDSGWISSSSSSADTKKKYGKKANNIESLPQLMLQQKHPAVVQQNSFKDAVVNSLDILTADNRAELAKDCHVFFMKFQQTKLCSGESYELVKECSNFEHFTNSVLTANQDIALLKSLPIFVQVRHQRKTIWDRGVNMTDMQKTALNRFHQMITELYQALVEYPNTSQPFTCSSSSPSAPVVASKGCASIVSSGGTGSRGSGSGGQSISAPRAMSRRLDDYCSGWNDANDHENSFSTLIPGKLYISLGKEQRSQCVTSNTVHPLKYDVMSNDHAAVFNRDWLIDSYSGSRIVLQLDNDKTSSIQIRFPKFMSSKLVMEFGSMNLSSLTVKLMVGNMTTGESRYSLYGSIECNIPADLDLVNTSLKIIMRGISDSSTISAQNAVIAIGTDNFHAAKVSVKMAQRRASFTATVPKPRQNFGTPHQIYTEVVNTGKNLLSTKRRVKWRFGWSETPTEHEVELIHSLVSGKKKIIEDGHEINTSANIVATDFSYGWNSEGCAHIFRVEATMSVTSETLYIFSIDGVSFLDMPRKQHQQVQRNSFANNDNTLNNSGGSTTPVTKTPPARRASTGVNLGNNNSIRASFQSPDSFNTGASEAFDPFASTTAANNAPFDPFQSTEAKPQAQGQPQAQRQPSPRPVSSSHHINPPNATTPASLFDAFADDSPPLPPVSAGSNRQPSNSGFDAFESSSAFAPSAGQSQFAADPFFSSPPAQKTPVVSTPTDPFASSQVPFFATSSNAPAQSNPFDPFMSSQATSTPAKKDAFDSDPFQTKSQASAQSVASSIANDFAGMTFTAAPSTGLNNNFISMMPPAAALPAQTPRDVKVVGTVDRPVDSAAAAAASSSSSSSAKASTDPWASSGLVNLNLTTDQPASSQINNNMMNNNAAPMRRASSTGAGVVGGIVGQSGGNAPLPVGGYTMGGYTATNAAPANSANFNNSNNNNSAINSNNNANNRNSMRAPPQLAKQSSLDALDWKA